MDQIKIGKFIAELRKEKGYTQERLGELIGVTNKTVSRWENGNYMPDIEMLSLLSKEFDVSINEIILGERIPAEGFKKAADANLAAALNDSVFTLKEKLAYFKKKWRREHVWSVILSAVVWLAVIIVLRLQCVGPAICSAIGGALVVLLYALLHNRMMAYVEEHVYRLTPDSDAQKGG